jgi:hypothetical protein
LRHYSARSSAGSTASDFMKPLSRRQWRENTGASRLVRAEDHPLSDGDPRAKVRRKTEVKESEAFSFKIQPVSQQ